MVAPRKSDQEASYVPEKVKNTCGRKKQFCVWGGGCSTKKGGAIAGLASQRGPRGGSGTTQRPEKKLGCHTGNQVVRRDVSGCHPHDTPQLSSNLAPTEFSARPHNTFSVLIQVM